MRNKTIQEKMQEILEKCKKENYIFRGERKYHPDVSSSLYRYYEQKENKIESPHFSVLRVEEEIVEKAKQHIRSDAPNIEVLTELQHFGGKTILIDFTRDINIALFFACNGKFNEDGRVILFNTYQHTEKTNIKYKNEKIFIMQPTGKSSRVIFQSSVFIHTPTGYLEENKYEIVPIKKEDKKYFLDHLRKCFNISANTIYNDIQGFVDNEENYSTASVEFYRGVAKHDEGQYEKAIKHYNTAIELNPQLAVAYSNRGGTKFALRRKEEAIKDLNKAIELNPQLVAAYCNRGSVKFNMGKKEDAINDYNKAIELDSRFAKAYVGRGDVISDMDRKEDAINDYNKAIELNPQLAEAYIGRGNIKSDLNEKEEAIEDYNKAIELDSQLAIAYSNRGSAKYDLGRKKLAIKDYNKAIELDPQLAAVYSNRGNAISDLGRTEEAIKYQDKAIKLDPKFAEAYINRGIAKSRLGRIGEAIKDLKKAKNLSQTSGDKKNFRKAEQTLEALKPPKK